MKYFSRRRTGYFGAAMVAMGLLLWARFLLITGHPKTAMATPEATSSTAASAGSDRATPGKATPRQSSDRERSTAQGESPRSATPNPGR